jgi:hypothetical protein
MIDTSHLPGAALIDEGVRDIERGEVTIAALLVRIAEPRLRRLGIDIPHRVPEHDPTDEADEIVLYRMLGAETPERAHARYNALLREITSFARAAEGLRT